MATPALVAATLATGAYLNAKFGSALISNNSAMIENGAKDLGKGFRSLEILARYIVCLILSIQTSRHCGSKAGHGLMESLKKVCSSSKLGDNCINSHRCHRSRNSCLRKESLAKKSLQFSLPIRQKCHHDLGTFQIGAVSGLINTNLRVWLIFESSILMLMVSDDTLKHCLDVSTARTIISTPDLAEFVPDNMQQFTLNFYSFSNTPSPEKKSASVVNLDHLPNPAVVPPPAKSTPKDISVLIYTSGTTGKPKACTCRTCAWS